MTNPRLSERHASLVADDRARADYSNPRLSERHANLFADDRARADYSNPRLSECHASLLADDRARADYANQEAIVGQVVCATPILLPLFNTSQRDISAKMSYI